MAAMGNRKNVLFDELDLNLPKVKALSVSVCMMFRAEGRLRFTYSSQTKTKRGWKHEGLAAGTEGGTMVMGLGNLYPTNETGIK